jgi:crotonobetainyl-CoA:carnitine CoA-transferase CaiB-like acyl-CoA transferase
MSGLMSITGEEGGGPVRVGASVGDITASLFGTVGILAALQERVRTGRGTQVDVAMLDAQIALLENAFSRFLNTGEVPRRIGTRHPLVTPFQAFEAADAALVVCCDTERQWSALCGALGAPELAEDPRFRDGTSRTRHHAELEPILARLFRGRSRAEWLARLEAADVPCGPMNSIADIAADPHVAARGMIAQTGENRYAALPIRTGSLDGREGRAAPCLGRDSEEVLAELGFPAVEIARLREAGVV